jgi:uncharacterized membrane protein
MLASKTCREEMSHSPASFPDLDADAGDNLDRIIGLSDGIFAFSMTLLAINVDLPALRPGLTVEQVTNEVLGLLPNFAVFATTFILVAVYWRVHRRTFQYIHRFDSSLIWLNILQLLFVAFLPVAAGAFDTYPYVPIVVAVYGGTLAIIGILGQLLWRHATGPAKLVDPDLSPLMINYYFFRGYFTIAIYLVLIALAFISSENARYVLFALVAIYPFLKHIYRWYWERRHPADSAS